MANEDKVLYLNADNVYGADELGLPYRDIMGEGVVEEGDFLVSERALGANMSVDVAAGACWIKGDDDTDLQPTYRYREPAVTNVAITAADPTDPRIDRIVAEVLDDTFAGVSKLGRVRAINGTPTTGATLSNLSGAAAVPNNAILLANVLVAAGETAINTADISDQRPDARVGGGLAQAGVNVGGTIYTPGMVVIERQALTASGAFDFNNIPQDFSALRLSWSVRGANAASVLENRMRLNADTTASYDYQDITGQAGAAAAAEAFGQTSAKIGSCVADSGTADEFSPGHLEMPDYCFGSKRRSWTSEQALKWGETTAVFARQVFGGTWRNTAAVNRIQVFPSAGFYKAGSTMTLYGLAG